jgi:hypothetical protein
MAAMVALGSICGLPAKTGPVRTSAPRDWKMFVSRAGWKIQYPRDWKIGTCKQCLDPTDPDVFVTFGGPSTKASVTIETLIQKPADEDLDQWLSEVNKESNLKPALSQEFTTVGGVRALRVTTAEGDNLYLVKGARTFAIRMKKMSRGYRIYQRMLASFGFTTG